jgi:hypothetical protein
LSNTPNRAESNDLDVLADEAEQRSVLSRSPGWLPAQSSGSAAGSASVGSTGYLREKHASQ